MASYERITLPDGASAFRKFLAVGHSDSFHAEAAGLQAMAATATVQTPAVIRVNDSELVTEWIGDGRASTDSWRRLGGELADMHAIEQSCFGFVADNYCGATPQPNPRTDDGSDFFARQRLSYQGLLARDRGLLGRDEMAGLEAIARRLPELVPEQHPALLHGDLWRGNVLFGEDDIAYLIDPAAHWGWPEADLGMTTLFGAFEPAFYDAYLERRPLEPGWRERLPLYNLYHLLNHLNLFGASYLGEVRSLIAGYA